MVLENTFESSCLRCGRKLAAASSVAAGYGRCCARKIRAAIASAEPTDFTAAQHEKAAELITSGGVVPARFPGVFGTVASAGDAYYLTHSAACNCPAGLHGLLCYHVAAVRLIAATTVRRAA
jgi:Family of unknown function (DUF6011)